MAFILRYSIGFPNIKRIHVVNIDEITPIFNFCHPLGLKYTEEV